MSNAKKDDEIFCPECGKPIKKNAIFCINCGIQINELITQKPEIIVTPKYKSTAIFLSIFLSFFSWLYTYKKSSRKFWFSFLLTAISPVMIPVLTIIWTTSGGNGGALYGFGFFYAVLFGIWVWAIIDNSLKSKTYYNNYPKE